MTPSRNGDRGKALSLMFEMGRIIRHACIVKETLPLPLSHLETVRFVAEKNNPTMRDIAEYLRIAAPSATAIVEALVAEGYLSRKEDTKDRRVVRLSVSGKGTRTLEKTMRARANALRSILDKMNATDQKELIRILSKVLKK